MPPKRRLSTAATSSTKRVKLTPEADTSDSETPATMTPEPTKPLEFLDAHPFVRPAVVDKIYGCIIGSALGDTIGLYTEFLSKKDSAKLYPSRYFQLTDPATEMNPDWHRSEHLPFDAPPTRFAACAWTDDTEQALLIHLGYLYNAARDPPDLTIDHLSHDFATRLKIWISQGLLCLNRHAMGIGALVHSIVADDSFLTTPIDVATEKWVASGRHLAPNGSLMRTHPIGVIGVGMSEEETSKLSVEIGRVTHVDPHCVVSCCIEVAVIRGLLRGDTLDEEGVNECIERSYDWVKGQSELMNPGLDESLTEEQIEELLDRKEFEKHVYAKTLEELELDDRKAKPLKIGYVYKCLGSALVLLRLAMRKLSTSVAGNPLSQESLFEDLMVDLIMESGDADTKGAAAGALVGAYLGYTQLPSHWTLGLAHREWLLKKTGRLAIAIGVENGSLEVEKDEQRDGGVGLMTSKKLKLRDQMLAAGREKKRKAAAARRTKSAKA